MVEANEDPMAVTMKIRRETRIAKDRAVEERLASQAGELQVPPPVPGEVSAPSAGAVAQIAVSAEAPHRPADAETAFRRARLGIVAAIALVMLLVWIMQRRARPPRGVV